MALDSGNDRPARATLQPWPRRGRANVHPAAHVDPRAMLGDGVEIGPGAFVGPEVQLERGVRVSSNAVLTGKLFVGADARIFPGAVVGEEPQDRSFCGEPSSVRIGARTCVREHATVHRACGEGAETMVGEDVLLMANSHVAHNCRIGDRAVLCNGALLAGHVVVSPQAILSGNVLVHQFVRIGRLAMIGGGSRVARDVPPFAMLVGDSRLRGLNDVGLRRAGVTRQAQEELRTAYRELFRNASPPRAALEGVAEMLRTPEGRELVAFLAAPSRRGCCTMRGSRRSARNDEDDELE